VYVADIRDPQKQRIAENLVMAALGSDDVLISEQVLNEFSSIALSKLKISKDAIKEYLRFDKPKMQRPENRRISQ
jgi:predicted nucleic acid-binding protein